MRRSSHAIDLGLIFVVVVWGFSPTVFKVVLEELQPLSFVFVRFVLLSVVSVGVLTWRGRRGGRAWRIARKDVPWLIVSGLSGYGVYQLFYMVGLAHTTVFASALLASTVPLWSAMILAIARIERIHRMQWIGLLVSLAGVVFFLVAGRSAQSELPADHALTRLDLIIGDALTLGAASLFALYGVVNKRLGATYSSVELMCYTLVIGTVALAPFGVPAVLYQDWSRVTWHTWVLLPYTVLFPIYLTYSIWNWAIRERGVGYVTLFSYAVPVMGGIVAFLAFGEALSPVQLGAGALVLGGMLAARWGVARGRIELPAVAPGTDPVPVVVPAEPEAPSEAEHAAPAAMP
ncbi:MAG: EamA family transporter [Ktedonobacterales bacterium]|nr:EamA family transporter [Ktedonobacterales bacterium]